MAAALTRVKRDVAVIQSNGGKRGMKNLARTILGLLSTTMALALPVSAVAQEDGDSINSLDEITVTARKREESLVDVPVSISVFSAEAIFEQGYQPA